MIKRHLAVVIALAAGLALFSCRSPDNVDSKVREAGQASPDPAVSQGPTTMEATTAPSTSPAGRGVRFADGRSEAVVKLQRGKGFVLTQEVKINGRDAGLFLIDTGASHSLIDTKTAADLELPGQATSAKLDSGPVTRHPITSLSIGGVTFAAEQIHSANLLELSVQFTTPLAGLIGGDVLRQAPFTIDYEAGTLTFYDPAQFTPLAEVEAERIEIPAFNGGISGPGTHPIARGRIDDVDCTLLLDTGQSDGLCISPQLTKAHPELVDRSRGLHQPGSALASSGQCFMAKVGRVKLLGREIAGLRNAQAFVDESAHGPSPHLPRVDASVGADLLENFRLTFDYASGRVWAQWRPPATVAQQLAAGLDANIRDLADQTPLMVAACRGDLEGCKALIRAGARAKADEFHGQSVLHFAARGGNADVVELILKDPSKPDVNAKTARGFTALSSAVEFADARLIKVLLDAGADVRAIDRNGQSALHYAVIHNNAPAVELLAKKGADLNRGSASGATPLALAATLGRVDVFDQLVALGARNVSSEDGLSPLHLAAQAGQTEMVQHLLKRYGAIFDVNAATEEGITPLIVAVQKNQLATAAALLKAGAKVDAAVKPAANATVLHCAAVKADAEMIKLLLEHKAAIEAKTDRGQTPLHAAALVGNGPAVEALLTAGANIEAADVDGLTPLHLAARQDCRAIVQALLKAGAKVEAQGRLNARALHLAAANGNVEVVRALLEAGADPAAKTEEGFTPADLARRGGYREVLELLR